MKFHKIGHSAYTSDMPYTAADINVGFVRWEAVAFGTAQLKLCLVFITTILSSGTFIIQFTQPIEYSNTYWEKEQQSKAQNLDGKYRQMALAGFDT